MSSAVDQPSARSPIFSQPISSSSSDQLEDQAAGLSAQSVEDDGNTPKSRKKRFLFGLGLWGLYSPWMWGGYWGGYGYGYPYYGGYNYYPYYNYYYPYYYYMPTAPTAAPAAVRRPLKKGKK